TWMAGTHRRGKRSRSSNGYARPSRIRWVAMERRARNPGTRALCRILLEILLERFFAGPLRLDHGLEAHRRLLHRARARGAIDLPPPRLWRRRPEFHHD